MIAFISPGQGSQRPGLLDPWVADADARAFLTSLADSAGFDLIDAGTTWDAHRLRDTRIAQPLLFAASLTAARAAMSSGIQPQIVAGHSVGEWTAAVLAGAISEGDGMKLVSTRAQSMARACKAAPTALAAVLGGDPQEVHDRYTALGLSAANNNGHGQVVVGGLQSDVARFADNPPEKARVRVLEVAGAFHTEYMVGAVAEVADAVAEVNIAEPAVPLVSNLDGHIVRSGKDILDRLVKQIAAPVRWDLCMQTFVAHGVETTVETCPAGTLSGLARRNTPTITALRVDDPAGLATSELQSLRIGSNV